MSYKTRHLIVVLVYAILTFVFFFILTSESILLETKVKIFIVFLASGITTLAIMVWESARINKSFPREFSSGLPELKKEPLGDDIIEELQAPATMLYKD